MFRRRRPARRDGDDVDEGSAPAGGPDGDPGGTDSGTGATPGAPARSGPWDVDDVDDPDELGNDPDRVDLGSLLVRGGPGLELRLQIDEATQQVIAAMLVNEYGALELRPFAAPRHEGMWADVRQEIAAEATRRGGTASEVDGAFGPELRVVVPVPGPDGRTVTQPSRVVGVDGPRWLLRGTFLGRPAVETDPNGVLETAFRDVVVVRGAGAMPPREPLPLRMPTGAQVEMPPPGAAG